jgi:hypothetical protein
MGTGEETKRAAELLGSGLLAGLVHLAYLSNRFSTEQGAGGVTLLFGCAFITLVLWAMLLLRSLAAARPLMPEVTDGLCSGAVTAWVMAVVPPRAANFLDENAADDFSRAYLPVSLVVVFVVLGAQALWPRREVRLVGVRFFASLAVALLALAAALALVVGGADVLPLAGRAGVAGLAAGVVAITRARAPAR